MKVLKMLTVFLCGGFVYGLIEITARGFTHISMGILGGAAMCLLHIMNEGSRTPMRLFSMFVVSALFITSCEYFVGELVNVRMGLGIWDYSHVPMNIDGQICLPFTLIWFALSAVGAVFDDALRMILFKENRVFLWHELTNDKPNLTDSSH